MRPLWKRFIRMPCETSQCCGREKLHFFSTAKYLYSPFNKRQILWIPMSSTALFAKTATSFLIFSYGSALAYIGRTISQSLKGYASIELKVLIHVLYTKLYNTCILGRMYFVERSIHLIEEHWLFKIITGVSDHTKQHCRNKQSMITPEAWTPVIINTKLYIYLWTLQILPFTETHPAHENNAVILQR